MIVTGTRIERNIQLEISDHEVMRLVEHCDFTDLKHALSNRVKNKVLQMSKFNQNATERISISRIHGEWWFVKDSYDYHKGLTEEVKVSKVEDEEQLSLLETHLKIIENYF